MPNVGDVNLWGENVFSPLRKMATSHSAD